MAFLSGTVVVVAVVTAAAAVAIDDDDDDDDDVLERVSGTGDDGGTRPDRVLGAPGHVVRRAGLLPAHLRLGLPTRRTPSQGNTIYLSIYLSTCPSTSINISVDPSFSFYRKTAPRHT